MTHLLLQPNQLTPNLTCSVLKDDLWYPSPLDLQDKIQLFDSRIFPAKL